MEGYNQNWEIVKEIAVIDENARGWRKEFNIIRWYGGVPKYDIRWWHPERKKCDSGVALTKEELLKIFNVFNEMEMQVS